MGFEQGLSSFWGLQIVDIIAKVLQKNGTKKVTNIKKLKMKWLFISTITRARRRIIPTALVQGEVCDKNPGRIFESTPEPRGLKGESPFKKKDLH